MGKLPTFIILLGSAALAAAVFGALHNQVSFSVGPTYFTALKFQQFGIGAALPERVGAAIVGVKASWWMGLLVGLPAFLYGLVAVPSARSYLAAGLGGIFLVLVLASLAALAGFLGGLLADATGLLDERLSFPDGPTRQDLLRAGFMHDASYFAGALGLLAAFVPMRNARRIDRIRAKEETLNAT